VVEHSLQALRVTWVLGGGSLRLLLVGAAAGGRGDAGCGVALPAASGLAAPHACHPCAAQAAQGVPAAAPPRAAA
jgi:hypothetical protein